HRCSPRDPPWAGWTPSGRTLLRVSDWRHGVAGITRAEPARGRPPPWSAHPFDADPGAGSDLLEPDHPTDRRRHEPGRHRPAPPHDHVADAVAVLVDDLQGDDGRGPAPHRTQRRRGVRRDPLEARGVGPAAGRRPGRGVVHRGPQHSRGVEPEHDLQRAVEEEQEDEEADRRPDHPDATIAAAPAPGPPPAPRPGRAPAPPQLPTSLIFSRVSVSMSVHMPRKLTHISAPIAAMISTTIAAETTPSPRSSARSRRRPLRTARRAPAHRAEAAARTRPRSPATGRSTLCLLSAVGCRSERRAGRPGGRAQADENRRSASTKGTARKITPGTSAATVTGIHTCWARRSIVSTSCRCRSRRMARASSLISRPRSPARRLRARTATSRRRASTSATSA